jgi:hypothetical protein
MVPPYPAVSGEHWPPSSVIMGGTVRGPLDHRDHNKQGTTAVWSCSW